jgi:hypothetical protein
MFKDLVDVGAWVRVISRSPLESCDRWGFPIWDTIRIFNDSCSG